MRSAHASIVEIEKGKRYRVFVELPRDPVTGKRRRLTRQIRGSRKDAEKAKAEMLMEAMSPDAASARLTLDQFFEEVFMPWAIANRRARTVAGYESNYSSLLAERLGQRAIRGITPLMITQLLNGIKPSRAHEAWRFLRLLLNKAVKMQLLDRNPVYLVDEPKVEKYKPEVLTLEEFGVYVEASRGTDIEPAMLVILGCGTTRSETVALNWTDIGLDGSVHIDNAITEVHGRPHDDRPKNEFRIRTVHLPASLTARMNEIRPACQFQRTLGGFAERPIITGVDGMSRMTPDVLSSHYRALQRNLPDGVKRISLKNLRHTSLTLAIEAGVDLLAVSRRAGHSGTAITARYYLRPSEALDVAAADRLDALISASFRPDGTRCHTEDGEQKEEPR